MDNPSPPPPFRTQTPAPRRSARCRGGPPPPRRGGPPRAGPPPRDASAGRLLRPDERAHELTIHLGRDGICIEAGAGEELARVLDPVDPSRLEVDRPEAGLRELLAILLLLERHRAAADPQLDALPDCGRHLAPDDDVGDRELPAGLQHAECLGQDAVL